MVEPEKAEERKMTALQEALVKKYQPLIKRAAELEGRMEAQEELIAKLNQLNGDKNDQLAYQVEALRAEASEKTAVLEQRLKEAVKKEGALRDENAALKLDAQALQAALADKSAASHKSSEKRTAELEKEAKSLRAEIQSLSKRCHESNLRIQDLEMENAVLKQGLGNSTFAK
jgi:regulator of replication initiation timing